MIRRPCYIAAPYGSPDPTTRARNVGRACGLGRLAIAHGLAPIVVHPAIPLIYGPDETPELRAMGLAVDEALVQLVARTILGELWVLDTDAGEQTSGVRQEVPAWWLVRGTGPTREGAWDHYQQAFRAAGLFDLWHLWSTR